MFSKKNHAEFPGISKVMATFICLLFLCPDHSVHAQDSLKVTTVAKDSIHQLIHLMQKGENDSVRFAANKIFRDTLEKRLQQSGSFDEDFSKLENISVQTSTDHIFRIYTWLIPDYDGNNFTYYGFIQSLEKKTGKYKLFELIDSTKSILKPQSEKLKTDKWLGAIYYSIIPVKKSGSMYYVVLGWKGKDRQVTQKIIDVLYFDKDVPKFGYPLFKTDKVFRNRIVFSYLSQVTMSLRFEEKQKMIIFDHLSGQSKAGETTDNTSLSGPDGTYDGFKFKGGKWILYHDVDVRTNWKPKKNLPQPPQEKK